MKKRNILITSNFSSDTGCAWKFFFRLFNVIAKDLHKRKIGISLSFAKVVEPVDVLDKDVPFHVFTFDPLNITAMGVYVLRKNVIDNNISYCYLTDFSSWHWLYPLLRFWGVKKIVVHTHSSVEDPYPPPSEKGIRKVLKKLIHGSKSLTADSIIACSEFVKDRLVRVACCPEEKIKVITHGIDIDRFLCNETSFNDRDNFVIFTVARATKHKGIHVLIEAAKLLRDKYSLHNYIVKYGGDGPDFQEFKKLVESYHLGENFKFLGELDDTRKDTCGADIVVIPSCWGDAYPLSVIEAMSAGKPVIATDVGGIPEEIGNENCGILIKPFDSDALAAQLVDLMRDGPKRERLGRNARMRAERLFTEKRFNDEVLAALRKELGLGT